MDPVALMPHFPSLLAYVKGEETRAECTSPDRVIDDALAETVSEGEQGAVRNLVDELRNVECAIKKSAELRKEESSSQQVERLNLPPPSSRLYVVRGLPKVEIYAAASSSEDDLDPEWFPDGVKRKSR